MQRALLTSLVLAASALRLAAEDAGSSPYVVDMQEVRTLAKEGRLQDFKLKESHRNLQTSSASSSTCSLSNLTSADLGDLGDFSRLLQNAIYLSQNSPAPPLYGVPGIEYIGAGYDVVKGNPLGEQDNIDPGFRGQVLDLTSGQADRCPDGNNLCPPNVWIRKVHRCTFSSESKEIDSTSAYQEELAQSVSVSTSESRSQSKSKAASISAGGGFGGFSARASVEGKEASSSTSSNAFTGSAGFKSFAKTNKESKLTSFQTTSECRLYTAGLQPYTTNIYKAAVNAIPDINDALAAQIKNGTVTVDSSIVNAGLKFFEDWGTHYTYRVDYGARYTVTSFMSIDSVEAIKRSNEEKATSTQLKETNAAERSVGATVAASGWGFSVDGSYSESSNSAGEAANANSNSNTAGSESAGKTRNMFSKTEISNVGGIPPLGNTPSDLASWVLSAESRPMPTNYELREITELLPLFKQRALILSLGGYSNASGAVNLDPADSNVDGEVLQMRFGTALADGVSVNSFAKSTLRNLRFKTKFVPPNMNADNNNYGYDRNLRGLTVTIGSPVKSSAFVTAPLLALPSSADTLLVDGGELDFVSLSSGYDEKVNRQRGSYQFYLGHFNARGFVDFDPDRGSMNLYATNAIFARSLLYFSGYNLNFKNQIVVSGTASQSGILSTTFTMPGPKTFISSPTQLNATSGDGVVAVVIEALSGRIRNQVYGGDSGVNVIKRGLGRYQIKFTGNTFDSHFSKLGTIAPTIIASPVKSPSAFATLNPLALGDARAARPCHVVVVKDPADADVRSATVEARCLKNGDKANGGDPDLEYFFFKEDSQSNPGPDAYNVMVPNDNIGISLLAFHNLASTNIKWAVYFGGSLFLSAMSLMGSTGFVNPSLGGTIPPRLLAGNAAVSRVRRGVYRVTHPFMDTPSAIVNIRMTEKELTYNAACNSHVVNSVAFIYVYCTWMDDFDRLFMVDAEFSIVIVGPKSV